MVGRYIEEPSMYRFAVFIVDETLIREKFANASTRWSPEEMLCENSECNEVTLSIYLSEQDITNDNGKKFQQEILYLLGLERPQKKKSLEQKKAMEEKEALKEKMLPSQVDSGNKKKNPLDSVKCGVRFYAASSSN